MYSDINSLECALRQLMQREIKTGLPLGLVPEFSVYEDIRKRQKGWAFQCLSSKGAEYSAGSITSLSGEPEKDILRICDDIERLSDYISGMVFQSLANKGKEKESMDDESVGYYIGLYVRYCILHNPWYVAADYNIVFIKSWFRYFDQLRLRLKDLGYKDV